jgi:hypothetical protein
MGGKAPALLEDGETLIALGPPDGCRQTGGARPLGTVRQQICYSATTTPATVSVATHGVCRAKDLTMKTFAVNGIADLLERDRATVIRALRDVPADAVERGQPRWKMVTAVAALHDHRRPDGGQDRAQVDPELSAAYEQVDEANSAMRKLETVEARRRAAKAMGPLITATDAMTRRVGLANGNDPELVHLRADKLYQLYLRGLELPCGWSSEQTWSAICQ